MTFLYFTLQKTEDCLINTEKIKNHLWLSTNKTKQKIIKATLFTCNVIMALLVSLLRTNSSFFLCLEGKTNKHCS